MKKNEEETFCPDCEWTGYASGITSCPVCGSNLSRLDSFDENELMTAEKSKYPSEYLSKIEEADDFSE